jgi:predicted phosphodiesterase
MRSEIGRLADEYLAKYPTESTHGIAAALAAAYPTVGTHEQFRSVLRHRRGARGKDRRHLATAAREQPPSRALPADTVEIAGPRRILILSDVHVPVHDVDAVQAAVEYGKAHAADTVLLNGDIVDFARASDHRPTPDLPEMREERRVAVEWLRWLREQFPEARIVYRAGNHEERLEAYAYTRAPAIWDEALHSIEAYLQTESLGIEFVKFRRRIDLGKLRTYHGHELPKGIASPVSAAKRLYDRMKTTGLCGHFHRTSRYVATDSEHRLVVCHTTGSLCGLTPMYARVNDWNHGFAFVELQADGNFLVDNLLVGSGGDVYR